MMPNERGNIFQEESRRPLVFDNSGKLKEKSASRVCKSSGISCCHRIRLAWEPADEQVEIGHFCCVNSCNVAIINLPLCVVNGFVSRRSVLVDLTKTDAFKAACFFKSRPETADSRKAVEKFNCYKTTSLLLFSL